MEMNKNIQAKDVSESHPLDISDNDILDAMKGINGYLDITPGDFKEVYRLAYMHAIERLTHLAKAKEVMTESVISVERDTPLMEVVNTLANLGISGVPVVEKDRKVVGIISEKDFLFRMGTKDARSFMSVVAQCLENKGCVAISMRHEKAEDIMTSPPVTVVEDTPVSEIANIFTEKNINRVPVMDQKGRLVGIVARTDIVASSCPPEIKIRSEG
jgi:CBS domain-containing protein